VRAKAESAEDLRPSLPGIAQAWPALFRITPGSGLVLEGLVLSLCEGRGPRALWIHRPGIRMIPPKRAGALSAAAQIGVHQGLLLELF
jgi:hypothetical protein